ncbi:hypothetical protein BpHYR1_035065 [Brachionus plicatilis]|uniref:Uncharacterized protein n=1 Tax=Brachionus plicatilis TaxID=10195 RepID=A0A3M7SZG7_BRAPC|nr:hypothetical protein BpHYR1_035065 [Brachionus plicatilis]
MTLTENMFHDSKTQVWIIIENPYSAKLARLSFPNKIAEKFVFIIHLDGFDFIGNMVPFLKWY